jgi:hypothetical protein
MTRPPELVISVERSVAAASCVFMPRSALRSGGDQTARAFLGCAGDLFTELIFRTDPRNRDSIQSRSSGVKAGWPLAGPPPYSATIMQNCP